MTQLRRLKFNIDRLYDPAVGQQWDTYLADRTADILNNPLENIDEPWAAIKNAVFSCASQVIGHVPKERHKIWLTAESWKQTDERKELEVLLTAASDGGRDALEFHYPTR